MKIKTQLTLLFVLFGLTLSQAQTMVSGTVLGKDGQPIPGATVIVQETDNGVISDFDGQFSIGVENRQNIEVSYIGFGTQIIKFTGQDTLSVTLVQDFTQLDEIVVTGYGTRKRSQLTGAVAKIGGSEVAAVQTARVDDALAGKLAGVLIQNQDGSPGAAPKIQIRAASSISGASNPLVVVDGYPISGGIQSINPNDIQSIEVLKDAASAAIYGSRGANGVITQNPGY
jgi:TonB-dependent SusC/RagA subfamily outer membrane receptor